MAAGRRRGGTRPSPRLRRAAASVACFTDDGAAVGDRDRDLVVGRGCGLGGLQGSYACRQSGLPRRRGVGPVPGGGRALSPRDGHRLRAPRCAARCESMMWPRAPPRRRALLLLATRRCVRYCTPTAVTCSPARSRGRCRLDVRMGLGAPNGGGAAGSIRAIAPRDAAFVCVREPRPARAGVQVRWGE